MEKSEITISETVPEKVEVPDQKPILFNRNFLLLWQGQFVSQTGSQAFAIAMVFWVKHSTDSATFIGTLLMLSTLPIILLGPIGGIVADRYSRKKIIILTDLLSGIIITAFAISFFLIPNERQTILVFMFIVSILVNALKAFFAPAISSILPDTIDKTQVTKANAILQSTFQVSTLIGQGGGGFLFRILGAPLLFLFDGISYLLSAFASIFLKINHEKEDEIKKQQSSKKNFLSDIKEGFSYIAKNKGMKMVFLSAALLNFFLGPIMVSLPFYIEDFLKLKVDWYGYFLLLSGFGMLIGSALAGIKKNGKQQRLLVASSYLLFAVLYALLGFTNSLGFAIPIIIMIGVCNGYININITSILQITTDSKIRGRVFGNLATLSKIVMPISYFLTGLFLDFLDKQVDLLFVCCGTVVLVISLFIVTNKDFNTFMSKSDKES